MKKLDLRGSRDPIPRPAPGDEPLDSVRTIIARVREEGDDALRALTAEFDGAEIAAGDLEVAGDQIAEASRRVPAGLIAAMETAAERIEGFSRRQLIEPWEAEIGDGSLGETVHPVASMGAYVPGGRAVYPSVVLMTVLPAKVAGVGTCVMCVPPDLDGNLPDATLAAAHLAGVDRVFRVGGAQAIAAMAFGTETIPSVDVICGGGGLYVALAKREVSGSVGIDSVAGPSEIAVVAGGSADPRVIAYDLIAQAEHGPFGAFALITWEEALLDKVISEVEGRLKELGSPDLVEAITAGAVGVLVEDLPRALGALAEFAPEHAELIFEGAREAASEVRNCGAVFVGPHTPVSLGDYLAGSNHTLPTMGSARWASGLRASLFQRTAAVVSYDEGALAEAFPAVKAFAEAEGLPNHAEALAVRLASRSEDSDG